MVEESPESVVPSAFVARYDRLFEQGDTPEMTCLSEVEYTSYNGGQWFRNSEEAITFFRRSFELYGSINATRTAAYCSHRMAREYFYAGDFSSVKQLLDGVADLYLQEGWVTLLWETLGYLRECSRRLGSLNDYVQYSLEMASLPVFSCGGVEAANCKRVYGPAGPPTLSHRETIQQEVFSLLKGHANELNSNFISANDQPISLDVDIMSPLRMAFLTSVAFHKQSVKPDSSAHITVSILSQLPHPVEIDQLEIQFNQTSCNFKVVNGDEVSAKESGAENFGVRVESVPSLILTTNKWLRMTFEIRSGRSGKLECMSVTAKLGRRFTLCCRAESPSSMEDLTLWKFEDIAETFPSKDPLLSFSGQKYIQVEEPEPLVDLNLNASGPALVGENFIVPVVVISKGHAVCSAELKINLVDARGGGMLMSPRDAESYSLEQHHVELVSVSAVFDDDSQESSDDLRKIQQSFGVVSVPFLDIGQSWSCRLEIKWNRPKSVMLYVSLGYLPNMDTISQRVNVHRSLLIEGKMPFNIEHSFVMPYRKEPLILSRIKLSPNVDQKTTLPLNETSLLILTARNCSEIPLRLVSISIEADVDQEAGCSCALHPGGDVSTGSALVVPGEDYKQIFKLAPQGHAINQYVGTVVLKWIRDSNFGQLSCHSVVTKQKLPSVSVEMPLFVVTLDPPPHVILGVPFSLYIKVCNKTSLLQEIKYSLDDSQSFVFTGPHNDSVFILPKSEHTINYTLVPLASGLQNLPSFTVTSPRYSAAMNPSLAATTIFVFPSVPHFAVALRND
ncbi:hypothetical protein HPP92_022427 [Vanilla planifolia]|uniref:Trafficking protein particle complex subunit 11 n=2 Tax=Vanilla planifolia TaxID=51239 RepID=A0A835PXB8_VANPL|nr:hypothetical protein HPP92_022427 [Vanilla planifolia]